MPETQPRYARLPVLSKTGIVVLRSFPGRLDPAEWESLTYLDWKSGGDTNFAVLASATGDDDPRGFWEHDKPDKDGIWTANALRAPTLRKWVTSVGARFGRVRIIKLYPSTSETQVTGEYLHLDDNNRLNPDGEGWVVRAWLNLTDDPDSYMILREDRDDPSTEHRIPLPAGAQFVVDTERLWHAAYHTGTAARYAMIASFESGPALQAWIDANAAERTSAQRPMTGAEISR
ncbi:hypothetical protein [Planosporangium mesophilum]|uniref:Uncharacterized protein n=1 Tax=Planosporangium mesophilum TaxID=689768 RepID=A0A8J3TGK5_9ACTN|nr:hypothetical protein [Planosporangium mesophilum]GII25397.1 hypothetical protein Pme01_49940 [Planosporangium mesophilum]